MLKKILFLFFLPFHLFSYDFELSLCAIFKDEAPYLKEWIEYHKIIGVQHFFLYNHNSEDHYKVVLEPYIASGLVELIEWDMVIDKSKGISWGVIQKEAYVDAIKKFKNKTKWLGIIDLDEYIVPIKTDSLVDLLKDYEEFSGLRINWQMYGTSNVKKIPNDHLLIESLFLKAPTNDPINQFVKTIVRPQFVKSPSAHYCIFTEGYAVDSNKNHRTLTKQPILIDKVRINHYWSKDEDFFYNVKLKRHKWSCDPGENCEKFNVIEDKTIFKYLDRLKLSMNLQAN